MGSWIGTVQPVASEPGTDVLVRGLVTQLPWLSGRVLPLSRRGSEDGGSAVVSVPHVGLDWQKPGAQVG